MYKIAAEKLINEIQKRPALWNMKSTDYNDRALKRQNWDELCVLFGNEEMTEAEKKELGDILHKKWKNIRDNFARDLQARKRKSGSEGGPLKAPYKYRQQLQFLRDIIELRETSNSLQESLEQEIHYEEAGSSSNNSTPVETPPSRKVGKKKSHPVEEQSINSLEILNKTNSETDDNNDNRLFLLSLLPTLSSLPKLLNSKCRLEIMKTLHKYEECALTQNHKTAPYYQPPGHFAEARNTRMMQTVDPSCSSKRRQRVNSTIKQFNYVLEDAISQDESSTSYVSNFSEDS